MIRDILIADQEESLLWVSIRMMRLYVAPTFERVVKKLYPQKKSDLDEAVRTLASDPECGEAKVGDLFGIRVYKFRL